MLALRSEKILLFVCIKHRYIDSTQTNGGGIRGKKCLKRLFRGKVIIKKKKADKYFSGSVNEYRRSTNALKL